MALLDSSGASSDCVCSADWLSSVRVPALCKQVFNDLDEKLQNAFTEYLEERGVDHKLGAFLVGLCEDKEQREYMNWLEGVAKFVKK